MAAIGSRVASELFAISLGTTKHTGTVLCSMQRIRFLFFQFFFFSFFPFFILSFLLFSLSILYFFFLFSLTYIKQEWHFEASIGQRRRIKKLSSITFHIGALDACRLFRQKFSLHRYNISLSNFFEINIFSINRKRNKKIPQHM